MNRPEQDAADAVAVLDASDGFFLADRPVCRWRPEEPATHHLHIPVDGQGISHSNVLQRIVMAAASSHHWRITLLDPRETYAWAANLPRTRHVADIDLVIAEVWMLMEVDDIAHPHPAIVVIPDYDGLRSGNAPSAEQLKHDAATGQQAAHIVLGGGQSHDTVPGWQTLTIGAR